MVSLLLFLLDLLGLPFKSKSRLAAENAALRQQVIVLQRKVRGPRGVHGSLAAARRHLHG
jgi:hypothetical protein